MSSSLLVSLVKDFGVINLPLVFNTELEADTVLVGAFGQELLAKLPEKSLIVPGLLGNGFRQVTNSRRLTAKAHDIARLSCA